MCGIAGILDLKGNREIDQDTLINMRDALIHRGPDEAGIYCAPGIGFAHRRLSIIDRASGQQPLSNQNKSITIVFNGEIYNFKELNIELRAMGYKYSTHSDTETIVHAWDAWGEKCVDKLRGMFAFAIWDARQDTLFLARDRLGIKPLLYAITDDGYFIFASEHKSLIQHPSLRKDINFHGIESYFALGYIAEPDSIYNSIIKLPAGYTLAIKDKIPEQVRQYWDVPFTASAEGLNSLEMQSELYSRLEEAIKIRLIAEVPLGAFLSGGVDSSAVVAIMSRLQPEPINTCSIGFDDPKFNEIDFANQVAKRYKTNHFQEIVDSEDYDLLDLLVHLYDEPFADSSALPTYRVCELAKKRVTVALSGDGADELMSGYRRHKLHLREEILRSILPLTFRKYVFGSLGKVYPKADWAPQWLRAKTTFQSLAMDSVSAYFNAVSQNSNEIRDNLYSSKLKSELNGYHAIEVFRRHARNAPSNDPQALIQYLDLKTYLVDDILTKVDRASMAHSLEVRVPIIDHKVVEWVSGISNRYKFDGKTGKSLLKKTMEPYLPADILYRKKMGFSVPLAAWFRGPLKNRMQSSLLSEQMLDTGWFNRDFLQKVMNEHQSNKRDYSTLLWSLLMFEGFLRKQ